MQVLKFLIIPLIALSLSGCIAAAIGAGAAGGAYFDKHYKISKKQPKASTSSTAKTDDAKQ